MERPIPVQSMPSSWRVRYAAQLRVTVTPSRRATGPKMNAPPTRICPTAPSAPMECAPVAFVWAARALAEVAAPAELAARTAPAVRVDRSKIRLPAIAKRWELRQVIPRTLLSPSLALRSS
jgi:hypothetical protein